MSTPNIYHVPEVIAQNSIAVGEKPDLSPNDIICYGSPYPGRAVGGISILRRSPRLDSPLDPNGGILNVRPAR